MASRQHAGKKTAAAFMMNGSEKQLSLTAQRKRVNVPKSTAKSAAVKRSRPKPKLGQNFLIDQGVARRIVEALGDITNRTVIEIGPGEGVLTDLLVSRA